MKRKEWAELHYESGRQRWVVSERLSAARTALATIGGRRASSQMVGDVIFGLLL
jgi:SH3-like domain-containing protein